MKHYSMQPTLDILCLLAKLLACKAEPEQISHRLGRTDGQIDEIDLCRAAHWCGLHARVINVLPEQITRFRAPFMVDTKAGWLLVTAINEANIKVEGVNGHERWTHEDLAEHFTGRLLLAKPNIAVVKKIKFGFSWFFPSIKKHKRQFIWVIAVSLMIQITALVSPKLFESIIDKVLVSRSLSSLEVLGLAMVALAVMEPVYALLRSWLFTNLSGKVNAELSGRLYTHLTALPLTYFGSRQTGQIIARVKEMEHIRQFLTGSALTLILDLAFVGLFISAMLAYSVELTGIVIVSLCVYFLFWLAVGSGLRHRVNDEFEQGADCTTMLTETVLGIETIKTTATESQFEHRWQEQLAHFVNASFRATRYGIFAGQGIGLIQKLTAALLLWFGVKLVLDGQLTPGQLVAFNMLSGHVTQPILRLAQMWQDFQHTLISLFRVGDILDTPAEAGNDGLASMTAINGEVEFRNVRFRYDDAAPEVLRGLNLNIRSGEFIGITGPSGSGKSTVTKLLQRLYAPNQGEVLIDGVDLAIADPVQLRRQMSVVLQDSHLFSGSIMDNICLNHPDASQEQVMHVAQLAGVAHFISDMQEGYETQVGEKGGSLSGGQRQRIALARALLSDPKILILDEATSALDYESEAAIMENMSEICRGRTVISIAHRLNTICRADRILVLEDGQVSEQGSHQSLLGKKGVYHKLWRLQTDK
ncbi:type I secretion system permease/ATPase [Aeromonas jandaei]|uniref:type I secretion system permease/ATPase n=1 Tax=Aeromonas jandaei TaxID=650 RepID=UPI002AA0B378|nr:type I secretion system permease/ATPase [Aeromonas jandaei]